MGPPPRRRAARAVLAAVAIAGALAAGAGVAGAERAVRLGAVLDRDATLGAASQVAISLQVDPHRTGAPVSDVRLAYPRGLGLATSGLGLATCTRPPSDFARVLITAPRLGGCPPNAVMAIGTVRALVRLADGQDISEYATVTMLSGAFEQDRLGLVVYIDGHHPFGAKLAFAGDLREVRRPYGGEVTVRTPPIPGIEDMATIYLEELRLTIGSHAIRYYERRRGRRVAYRPEGVVLPAACPPKGFPFRVRVGFADGSSRTATALAPCPPPVAAPASGV